MKILIASSAFKGTFRSAEVCEAFAAGARAASPKAEVSTLALADGGEGTLESFLAARGGRVLSTYVTGPRNHLTKAHLGLLDSGGAVIEIAQAAGLSLVPHHARNPEFTTTFGVGELILQALERGCPEVTITLGDSATIDGGLGMAQALGYSLRDAKDLEVGHSGGVMLEITHVLKEQAHPRIRETEFSALCDVQNPLLGNNGAAPVFGPQKGAGPEMVDRLEEGLRQLAEVVERDLGADPALRDKPGAGAAGGLGWGCMVWLGARLRSGADAMLDLLRFDDALEGADVVIAGEGRWDAASGMGKATGRIVERARAAKKRGLVLCASGDGENVFSATALGEDREQTPLGREDLVELARIAVEKTLG